MSETLRTDAGHAGWDLPDVFSIELEVADAECDRLGHANNASYLQWCERVAWAHAEAVGAGFELWQREGRAMAVQRAHLSYEAPCGSGARLVAGNWLVRNDGRVRATRRFQIRLASSGVTLLRGEIDYVCIDLRSGRPRRMPESFRDAYRVLPTVEESLPLARGL